MDILWHKHHLIPRHAGGTDDKYNLVKVNVPMHAMLHKIRWEETSDEYDLIAWRALSGTISSEMARREAASVANKVNSLGNQSRAKTYIYHMPDGDGGYYDIKVFNLAKFCREMGINSSVARNCVDRSNHRRKLRNDWYFSSLDCEHPEFVGHSKQTKQKLSEAAKEQWRRAND